MARIDVIRNNKVVHCFPGGAKDVEQTWRDEEPLSEVMFPPAKFCPHPFAFYYVRVIQEDGEVAWASPIWIDA